MAFLHKSINPSTHMGKDLQELREQAGLTRAQVSQHTKITEAFIRALEEERWDEITDPVYTERILRAYVTFLGGKEKYILQKYRACVREHPVQRKPEDMLPRPRQVRVLDFVVGPRILAIIGFFLFVGALGGYIYVQAHNISSPPPLRLDEPTDGMQLNEPHVRVRGETSPDASVSINGLPAIVQSDGTFALTLDVPRGTTQITVSSKKRRGRDAIIVRRVVYDRPLPSFYEAVTSTTE
jgi:cytoskeletal protein RodZ